MSLYEFLIPLYPVSEPVPFTRLRPALAGKISLEPKDLEDFANRPPPQSPVLPDEAAYHEGVSNQSWVAGGEDGAHWYHGARDEEPKKAVARLVLDAVRDYVMAQSPEKLQYLEDLLLTKTTTSLTVDNEVTTYRWPVIHWGFQFMQMLAERYAREKWSSKELGAAMALGRALAFESDSRCSVKLGLLILGSIGSVPCKDEDIDGAMLLGRHEEFTLYASRMLYQRLDDPLPELWELALGTRGWGRIIAIRTMTLLRNEGQKFAPVLTGWLLRNGYANHVLIQYNAVDIVEGADLLSELQKPEVDDGILAGASELLASIVAGGPIQVDLNAWPPAKGLFHHYLRHVRSKQDTGRFRTDFVPANFQDT